MSADSSFPMHLVHSFIYLSIIPQPSYPCHGFSGKQIKKKAVFRRQALEYRIMGFLLF